ncbi:MAG: ABC transporter permease [Acidimicrobiia bacterium]
MSTTKASGWELAVRATLGRATPRVIGSVRELTWLFYGILLPLLGTTAFVYVYRALGAPSRYVTYVVMGGAAVAFWMNVLWMMAAQFWWEKRIGNLELYLSAPCGMFPILLGMSLGGIVATLVRAAAVVTVGVAVFDAHFDLSRLPMLLVVFVLSLVALYGLGSALASLFLYWGREAYHTINLFTEPVFLVSGMYFPASTLGFWGGVGAAVVPLTVALDALRQLLVAGAHPALLSLGAEIALLGAFAVLYPLVAAWAIRRMEHLARVEGRLSRRN